MFYKLFNNKDGSIWVALIAGSRLKRMEVTVANPKLIKKVIQEKRGFKGVKREIICIRSMLKIHPINPLIRAIINDIIR